MNVFALGRTAHLYHAIKRLSANHEVTGILTAEGQKEYQKDVNDFVSLADSLGVPCRIYSECSRKEIDAWIKRQEAQVAVSVNWVTIVGEEWINSFQHGIVNAHFGDLPRYRGNAVTNWALLNGEQEITFTLHFMEPGEIDSGAILAQEAMKIDENTTIADINDRARACVPDLFERVVNELESGALDPVDQSSRHMDGFRCYPRIPSYSRIDWEEPVRQVHRLVRASTRPYPGAYTYLKRDQQVRKLYVWSSRIVTDETEDMAVAGHVIKNDSETGETHVKCGSGVLALQTVSYEGEETFQPGQKWNSIRFGFFVDVEEEIIRLQDQLNELHNEETGP